jgi:hypothetical protein
MESDKVELRDIVFIESTNGHGSTRKKHRIFTINAHIFRGYYNDSDLISIHP